MRSVERHSLQWARWLSDGNAKWTHCKKQDRARSPHFVFAKELKLAEGESQEIPESFLRPRANRRRICLKTHKERAEHLFKQEVSDGFSLGSRYLYNLHWVKMAFTFPTQPRHDLLQSSQKWSASHTLLPNIMKICLNRTKALGKT